MREVVLDTETTGLDPESGHRIVEIGCVELQSHMPTGRTYHQYINPDRDMPAEAFAVHGISNEFLADKPRFAEVADAFLAFVGSAKLVIHNAAFDIMFLNAELRWAEKQQFQPSVAIDTLDIARKRFPGAQNSLDALCRRFGVDNSAREKHGALLDSEILAEVYLELLGGRQPDLALAGPAIASQTSQSSVRQVARQRSTALPSLLTETEKAAHAAFVDDLGNEAIWKISA